jgi:hypothetical protein
MTLTRWTGGVLAIALAALVGEAEPASADLDPRLLRGAGPPRAIHGVRPGMDGPAAVAALEAAGFVRPLDGPGGGYALDGTVPFLDGETVVPAVGRIGLRRDTVTIYLHVLRRDGRGPVLWVARDEAFPGAAPDFEAIAARLGEGFGPATCRVEDKVVSWAYDVERALVPPMEEDCLTGGSAGLAAEPILEGEAPRARFTLALRNDGERPVVSVVATDHLLVNALVPGEIERLKRGIDIGDF